MWYPHTYSFLRSVIEMPLTYGISYSFFSRVIVPDNKIGKYVWIMTIQGYHYKYDGGKPFLIDPLLSEWFKIHFNMTDDSWDKIVETILKIYPNTESLLNEMPTKFHSAFQDILDHITKHMELYFAIPYRTYKSYYEALQEYNIAKDMNIEEVIQIADDILKDHDINVDIEHDKAEIIFSRYLYNGETVLDPYYNPKNPKKKIYFVSINDYDTDTTKKFKKELEILGAEVIEPEIYDESKYSHVTNELELKENIKKANFKKMKKADKILIAVPYKPTKHFINMETFVELIEAQANGKEIYILSPIVGTTTWELEILKMNPIQLNGEIGGILDEEEEEV